MAPEKPKKRSIRRPRTGPKEHTPEMAPAAGPKKRKKLKSNINRSLDYHNKRALPRIKRDYDLIKDYMSRKQVALEAFPETFKEYKRMGVGDQLTAIRSLQHKLVQDGVNDTKQGAYHDLSVDGLYGRQTRSALNYWSTSQGNAKDKAKTDAMESSTEERKTKRSTKKRPGKAPQIKTDHPATFYASLISNMQSEINHLQMERGQETDAKKIAKLDRKIDALSNKQRKYQNELEKL